MSSECLDQRFGEITYGDFMNWTLLMTFDLCLLQSDENPVLFFFPSPAYWVPVADVWVWLAGFSQGTFAGILIGLAQLNCSELKLKRLCCRHG